MLVLIGICGILSFLVLIAKSISRRRKVSLFFVELCAALLLTFDRLAYLYRGNVSTTGWWMVRVSNFAVFFLSLAVLYAFNSYLIDLFEGCKECGRVRTLRLSRILLVAGAVLLIVSQFTGLYYSFDGENRYTRAPGFAVCYIIPLLVLVMQAITILRNRRHIQPRIFVPIFLFTLVPLGATVLQLFLYGLSLTNISIVWMAIMLYTFALKDLNDSVESAHKRELELLEKYNTELAKTVEERTSELKDANEKVKKLLLNILPKEVVAGLAEHPGMTIAQDFPNVTVLFTDIVGFTKLSGNMTADEIVSFLNKMVSLFDERAQREGVEKIKTIGDSYMAATGMTWKKENDGAKKMLSFAMGLLDDVKLFNEKSPVKVQIRLGINTGSLVAGVIGKTKFVYDIWGDTVNVASRMESYGTPMRIHVSEETYLQTKDSYDYKDCVEVEVKGKGLMKTYLL